MDKGKRLELVNKKWIGACTCALRGVCTQAVPGEGSADTKIMFIGEAPGKEEDKQGRPFVGAAGKFLAEMLASIHLTRADVYITNVVKYRPPNNRDPLPDEVEACWPWLEEQVKIIDPLLIVLLGRHAMERFLPNQKISRIHGTALRRTIPGLGTRIFYALYHPAAALYQGSLRDVLIKDFKRIPKVLEAAGNMRQEMGNMNKESGKENDDDVPRETHEKRTQKKLF